LDVPSLPGESNSVAFLLSALRSPHPNLVFYALSRVRATCDQDRRVSQLLPPVIGLISCRGTSKLIEWAAVGCVAALLPRASKTGSASVVQPILDRLRHLPAVEYVECLAAMATQLTSATLSSCIIPLIEDFLGRAEPYQFAAGALLRALPISAWDPTPGLLLQLLSSRVVVSDFLPGIIRAVIEAGHVTEEWCLRTCPQQLVVKAMAAREFRPGATAVLLEIAVASSLKVVQRHIEVLFCWASDFPAVALLLLAKADELVTARTIELMAQIKDLLVTLAASPDIAVRAKLPEIIVANPVVFLYNATSTRPVIDALMNDRAVTVRLAVIDHFVRIFSVTADRTLVTTSLSAFTAIYADRTRDVVAKLCSRETYTEMGANIVLALMPTFIQFIAGLRFWRHIRDAMVTFATFSDLIVYENWGIVTPIVFAAIAKFPTALVGPARGYCRRIMSVLKSPPEFDHFFGDISAAFGKSDCPSMRAIFPAALAAVAQLLPPHIDIDPLFRLVLALDADQAGRVQVALIRSLPEFRKCFRARRDGAREAEVVRAFAAFEHHPVPWIRSFWQHIHADAFQSDIHDRRPASKTSLDLCALGAGRIMAINLSDPKAGRRMLIAAKSRPVGPRLVLPTVRSRNAALMSDDEGLAVGRIARGPAGNL
jgi:hypothetical protein